MNIITITTTEVSGLPTHVKPISWKTARRIIENNHYLQYAPAGQKFSLGIFCNQELVGVMMFGHPTARQEDPENTLELTRMFLFDGIKNSESRAISLSEKWIRKNRTEKRLIAYSDTGQGHKGTIYKAANWKCLGERRLWSWSKSRAKRRGAIGGIKLKFERVL